MKIPACAGMTLRLFLTTPPGHSRVSGNLILLTPYEIPDQVGDDADMKIPTCAGMTIYTRPPSRQGVTQFLVPDMIRFNEPWKFNKNN